MDNTDTNTNTDTKQPRIIKKYPNRRLYDTCASSYITMMDLRQLITDSIEFKVVDTRNGNDITRSILMQIIAEQEEHGDPLFSTDVLMQLIRGYGDAQSMFSGYLQESAKMFSEQQKQMQQVVGQIPMAPMDFMNKLGEQQMQMWKRWGENVKKDTGTDDLSPTDPKSDSQDNNS
ncbi:MAG: polyhydroxyalkanoate synthesis repressor PhaR [Candidatus Porifericomitaceae bacterium WSBS_2022_MAG_OTU9]